MDLAGERCFLEPEQSAAPPLWNAGDSLCPDNVKHDRKVAKLICVFKRGAADLIKIGICLPANIKMSEKLNGIITFCERV